MPLGEDGALLTTLQALPGFDNETFIRAMTVADEGVLWRADASAASGPR